MPSVASDVGGTCNKLLKVPDLMSFSFTARFFDTEADSGLADIKTDSLAKLAFKSCKISNSDQTSRTGCYLLFSKVWFSLHISRSGR